MKDVDTQKNTAAYLGCSTRKLYEMRQLGAGPKFILLGSGPKAPIRYRKADVDAWLAQQEVKRVS